MMSNARLTWENAPGSLAITGFVNNLENALVFANSTQSPGKPGVIYNQLRPPHLWRAWHAQVLNRISRCQHRPNVGNGRVDRFSPAIASGQAQDRVAIAG
jgi:hypothetical protein